MNTIKKLPYPIVGLMLGLAALGNLLGGYNMQLKYAAGITSAFIGLMVIIKIIALPQSLRTAFDNPVVGSVMAAFPMAWMLLSTYIKPVLPSTAIYIWYIAIGIHISFIIVYTKKYIINFNINKVFPSYFVMYVGIICASVSSKAFQMESLGQYIFWFGLISYLILLPIVIYRVVKIKNIPPPAVPTLVIFAAPASLCLVGYMSTFQVKSPTMVYGLSILALIMALYGIVKAFMLIKRPFMPSFSAFTFPIVISAIAMNVSMKYINITNGFTSILRIGFTVIASFMVLFVLVKYTVFMFRKNNA